jgi:hypothetical protein
MVAGDAFSFDLSKRELGDLLTSVPASFAGAAEDARFTARLELQRVSALQRFMRTVAIKVEVQQQGGEAFHCETHQVQVKDMGGVFVFEGPMADATKPLQQVSLRLCFAQHCLVQL